MPMHEVGGTRSAHSGHRHSTGYGSVHIRRALREPIGAGAVLGGVRALHVPLFATATPIKHQGSTGNLQGNDTGNTTGSVNQSHTQRHTNCIHTFNAAKDMSSSQDGRWYSPSTAAGSVSPPTSRSSKNSAPRSLTWDANRPEKVQSSCTGSHGTDAYGFVHHVSVNTNSATYTATANSHVHTHELGKPPAQHTEPPPQAPPSYKTHSIELCNSARRWRQHPPRQRGVHAQGWHSVQLQPCGRAHTHAHGLHNGTSLTVVDSRSTRHTGTYPRGAHWDRIHSGQVARWWLPRRCRPSSRVYTRPRGRLPGMPSMPGR